MAKTSRPVVAVVGWRGVWSFVRPDPPPGPGVGKGVCSSSGEVDLGTARAGIYMHSNFHIVIILCAVLVGIVKLVQIARCVLVVPIHVVCDCKIARWLSSL